MCLHPSTGRLDDGTHAMDAVLRATPAAQLLNWLNAAIAASGI
jgi:hypothetical protein